MKTTTLTPEQKAAVQRLWDEGKTLAAMMLEQRYMADIHGRPFAVENTAWENAWLEQSQ